jgi:hypothetical protein
MADDHVSPRDSGKEKGLRIVMSSTARDILRNRGLFPCRYGRLNDAFKETETNHLMMWRRIDAEIRFNHLETRSLGNGDEIFRWVRGRGVRAGHMIARGLVSRGKNDVVYPAMPSQNLIFRENCNNLVWCTRLCSQWKAISNRRTCQSSLVRAHILTLAQPSQPSRSDFDIDRPRGDRLKLQILAHLLCT